MPEQQTPSLKPCPFCGNTQPVFERLGSPRQSCIVACDWCGCRHESSDENERSGTQWNERVIDADLKRQRDQLLEALKALVEDVTDADHSPHDWSEQVVMKRAIAAIAAVEGPQS